MNSNVDFIGVGAQKAGTSWIYACLYEHPEICAPYKEIHFFSREKNWSKGREWYGSYFRSCERNTKKGEFSTSYLYSDVAAQRIKDSYPDVKIIISLRNPVKRAFSQYRNAIKMQEVSKNISFEKYVSEHPSAIEQGKYYEQVKRYLDLFGRERVLVLIHENSRKDPKAFIQSIYRFLEVDETFIPSMLEREVNVARTPRAPSIDIIMMRISGFLRKNGFGKIVWFVKKCGLADVVRAVNTEKKEIVTQKDESAEMQGVFREDIDLLSKMIERDLKTEWFKT